jgi:hypothetical protein
MEDKFKKIFTQRLEVHKNKSFQDAVYGEVNWGEKSLSLLDLKAPRTDFSEKSIILESFSHFAQDKLAESPDGRVVLERVEITKKSPQDQVDKWISQYESKSAWYEWMKTKIPLKLQHFYQDLHPEVIVICDSNLPLNLEAKLESELFFEKDVLDLWEKMLKAMNVSPHKKWTLSVEQLSMEEIKEFIYWLQPKIVITLGAVAIQKLIQTKDRLSSLHGSSQILKMSDLQFLVIPLFHPSLLINNQNMKKTTWADMQTIIDILKK